MPKKMGTEEVERKPVCIKDAPLKVNLMSTHGIVQKVSGRRNKLKKTVSVRLIVGKSPSGGNEFEMGENEKVNVLGKSSQTHKK
jgi:hypothetical protein